MSAPNNQRSATYKALSSAEAALGWALASLRDLHSNSDLVALGEAREAQRQIRAALAAIAKAEGKQMSAPEYTQPCFDCEGRGYVLGPSRLEDPDTGSYSDEYTCESCRGTGGTVVRPKLETSEPVADEECKF